MPLESITNGIEDLNSSWPTGTDKKSEGDNHLRNLKLSLQLSFPNTTGAWTTTSKFTCGGVDASGLKVENLAAPTVATDSARKAEVDSVQTNVDTLAVRVTDNEADILANAAQISTNETNITANDADIASNSSRISALEAQSALFQSFGTIRYSAPGVPDLVAGSGDFSVAWISTGVIDITFTEAASGTYGQSLTANVLAVSPFVDDYLAVVFPQSTTVWRVTTFNGAGNEADLPVAFTRMAD